MKSKCCLFFIVFYLIGNNALYSQSNVRISIDSLINKLTFTTNDSNRIKICIALCGKYNLINKDSAIIFGNLAVKTAKKMNWDNAVAKTKNKIGLIYSSKNELAKALNNYLEAKKIYETTGNLKGLGNVIGNIGNIFYTQKNYQRSLYYYQKALEIQIKTNNTSKIANNFGNIANIYAHFFDTTRYNTQLRLNLRKQALIYYNKAANMYRKIGDIKGVARNTLNSGNLYKHNLNKTKAIVYYKAALNLYKSTNNAFGLSASAINIADIYLSVLKDTSGLLQVFNLKQNSKNALIDSVVRYANLANKIAEKYKFNKIIEPTLYILSYINNLKGNYKEAYLKYKKYSDLKISIYQKNNAEKINKIIEKNTAKAQERKIKMQKMQLDNRQNITLFLLSILALLIVLILFIFKARKKTERLLLNILPFSVAKRLKKKEYPIADKFENVSIIFIDLAGFTAYSAVTEPDKLLETLNHLFTEFDAICKKHGLEKIKTIGDCYMAASGLPIEKPDHAVAAAKMALEASVLLNQLQESNYSAFNFRIGLHCGPVVAGVIGRNKFAYDLWGDAVNIASRMESAGEIGQIQCTEFFKNNVMSQTTEANYFYFSSRGKIEIKGKGKIQTWFLSMYAQQIDANLNKAEEQQ